MRLDELGWDESRTRDFAPWAGRDDVRPTRVLIEYNHNFRVAGEGGDLDAVVSGRLKHQAVSRAELPAVGDWVVLRIRADEPRGAIIGVLPRRSHFSRRMAGQVTDEQVVAANIDVVFIVMALDHDFSPRRLERYLLLAHQSGAAPVVLLTKPDVEPARLNERLDEVRPVTGLVPLHVVNPRLGQGVDVVRACLGPGRTGALLGSSGVGKSTIINRLAGGELQRTRDVRTADSKGRHTTTHRELVQLPDGSLLIDTPGMREIQLWDAGDAVRETFEDVEALAADCRFADCRHLAEPRCAVKAAVAAGTLAQARLDSYQALQAELVHLAQQQDERSLLEEKRKSKVMGKALKDFQRRRPRGKL